MVTPLVIARIEAAVPTPNPGRRSTAFRLFGAVGAAAMTMTSVLLLVFILPWLGAIFSVVTLLAVLVVPFLVQRRQVEGTRVGDQPISADDNRLAPPIGRAVSALATRPRVVLPVAVAITAAAAVFAVQVPAEFDVENFFSSDTDFVVGLDQLDTHVGDRGGEPALLYVEGDLTDPNALAAVAAGVDEIRALDVPSLARDENGVAVDRGIFSVFDAAWASEPMAGIVLQQTGVQLTDTNADGIPDTQEQVTALIGVASDIGVPFDANRPILTPDDVNTAVQLDGANSRTVFEMGVVDSRSRTGSPASCRS